MKPVYSNITFHFNWILNFPYPYPTPTPTPYPYPYPLPLPLPRTPNPYPYPYPYPVPLPCTPTFEKRKIAYGAEKKKKIGFTLKSDRLKGWRKISWPIIE